MAVGLTLWLVSGIALNKYRYEYGTRFSRIALKRYVALYICAVNLIPVKADCEMIAVETTAQTDSVNRIRPRSSFGAFKVTVYITQTMPTTMQVRFVT